jgi:hypothetical protein
MPDQILPSWESGGNTKIKSEELSSIYSLSTRETISGMGHGTEDLGPKYIV